MKKSELLIISAYTGYSLVEFPHIHKFCEQLLGRPIFTHELANNELFNEIHEKCKPLLLEICDNAIDDLSEDK